MKKYIINNIQNVAFFCLSLPLILMTAIILFQHSTSWCMPLLILSYLTCILISDIAYLIAMTNIEWKYKDISEEKLEKWTDALKFVFKTYVQELIDSHLNNFWFWCPIGVAAVAFIARLINIYF